MSVRSNEDRMGVDRTIMDNQDPPPMPVNAPAAENSNSSLLSYVVPTEFVELPSKGRLYPPNHPLCNASSVEIRHMTAKDEDILTSTTLLKQGVALDRMLQNILVDGRIKIKDLLLGDKNALIVAARVHGYGPEYQTEIRCPQCSVQQQYTFDLNSLEVFDQLEEIMETYDIRQTESNTFLLPLPKTEHTVELKLLTGIDEKKLAQMSKMKKKHKLMETSTTSQLKVLILSINGTTDRRMIEQFVDNLPAIDSRYLRRVYQKLMPTINLEHFFTCTECAHESVLEVPFTTDFFWSN